MLIASPAARSGRIVDSADDLTAIDFADIVAFNRLASTFVQELMIRAADLLADDQARQLSSPAPFPSGRDGSPTARVHQALLLTVDDDATRQALRALVCASHLRVARVQAAFAYEIGRIMFESGQAAALQVRGSLQPVAANHRPAQPDVSRFPHGATQPGCGCHCDETRS